MRVYLVTGIVFVYAVGAIFLIALTGALDHDEHQFMTSAYLVAMQGLQPYQDFPYFHTPNLVYLYALLFRLSDYPLLAARFVVGGCTLTMAGTLFGVAWSIFGKQSPATRLIIAAASVLLFVNSPLLASATAHVWNHTPATLCALLAFVLHCRGIRRNAVGLLFASGLLLGMAMGIRLTFAPLAAPFLLAFWLPAAALLQPKLRAVAYFASGGLLANLPALYFLVTAPSQFWFGNLGYITLNTSYRQTTEFNGAMSLLDKGVYFIKSVWAQPTDLLILVAILYIFSNVTLTQLRSIWQTQVEAPLLAIMLPLLYLTALAPTPVWYQYFFAPLPFALLALLFCQGASENSASRLAVTRLMTIIALLSLFFGPFTQSPATAAAFLRPTTWFPVTFHATAVEVARQVKASGGQGKVLTIAPLYAVEAGLPVYPQLATGPFAWRIVNLLLPEERHKQGLPDFAEWMSLLKAEPPAAVLVTNNVHDVAAETQLIRAARRLGFHAQSLADGSTLWLP